MKRLALVLPILILSAVAATAGEGPTYFSDLRQELLLRVEILSGSEDKIDQQQEKACLKGLEIIPNNFDLADNIKASGKLAKLLEKAFPNEFTAVLSVVFSNNIRSLLFESYNNIGGVLGDYIEEVQSNVNLLPEGNDRSHAQEALNEASLALDEAAGSLFGEGDFKATTKHFKACLKFILKAVKIAGNPPV